MSIDHERGILGTALFAPGRVQTIDLKPRDFESEAHQFIWLACQQLGDACTELAVIDLLSKNGMILSCGGSGYITGLGMEAYFRDRDIESAVDIIKEDASVRRLTSEAQKAVRMAERGSSSAQISKCLSEAVRANVVGSEKDYCVDDLEADIEEVRSGTKKPFIFTGVTCIDQIMGLQVGQVSLLAARAKVGKTYLANYFCERSGDEVPQLFISLEMTPREMYYRRLALYTRINYQRLIGRSGILDEEEMEEVVRPALKRMKAKSLISFSFKHGDVDSLAARIAHWRNTVARDHERAQVFIDNLGQVKVDGRMHGKEDMAIGPILNTIHSVAQREECHIWVLHHGKKINSTVPGGWKLTFSDIRGNDRIIDWSHNICILNREALYNPAKAQDDWHRCEFQLAFSRDGGTGTVGFDMHMPTGRVREAKKVVFN